MNTPATSSPSTGAPAARRKALGAIAAVVGLGALAWAGYALFIGARYETTDNAYVSGSLVQITPQVGGTVQAVLADDTDFVKAGQAMVRLDPADAQVALEQAEAALAQTVREVRTLFAANTTLASQVRLRESELARVRADLARAQDDVNRRTPLVASGAVGREEFNHASAALTGARNAVAAAESALAAARDQLQSNQALTDGTTPAEHPNVLRAAARVREADLARQRTTLAAPIDGYVARRNVQVGQRVQAGSALMAVIPLQDVWVDANFKESQLRKLRIDQPVELQADVYGSKVTYQGRVVGLGAGTGSAFALLPAQNATGNWIKVVQRVPVRVSLDNREVAEHPLRVGLSMEARVDVSDASGRMLADASHPSGRSEAAGAAPAASDTPPVPEATERRIRDIIGANLGPAPATTAPHPTDSVARKSGNGAVGPASATGSATRVASRPGTQPSLTAARPGPARVAAPSAPLLAVRPNALPATGQ